MPTFALTYENVGNINSIKSTNIDTNFILLLTIIEKSSFITFNTT